MTNKTILIVDDNGINRRILSSMLKDEYSTIEAADGTAALDILSQNPTDISAMLLDIYMPVTDGFEVLRKIRASLSFSTLPVIIMTASDDETTRIRALTMGANDFVMKPYNPDILKHCLHNNIALSEATHTVSALQRDRLTGLLEREAFFTRVKELVAEHEPGYYIMACFDVNKFKVINDQYGTQKGDEVLCYLANTFEEGFTKHGGICCRVSADDFAVLYPASICDGEDIAELRRKACSIDGLVSPLVFSIGRYIVNDLSMSPSSMYDRAMLAADSVKGNYEKQIEYYNESMHEQLIHEQQMVMEMENALRERQFEVWLQPQFNYSNGTLIGAEALVRWRHPDKNLISPGTFIPLFEQNGFIYTLDKFVWEESCRYLSKWLNNGGEPLAISVNISRYDLFRPDLVEIITGLVKKYNIPVNLLRLEITESAFAESTVQIVTVVKQLIEHGFTVEIDDFGSGYSSLNTLKDVPAQIIKLDMNFLESSDSGRGGNIIESVVRMAKWLGMTVIAEGVETVEQADFLKSIGCSYIQGYLYARPMPAEEYERFCENASKENRLAGLETVENLDNRSFWNPQSMDTLIFNSFVGGACVFEYGRRSGKIELLRATDTYTQVIGNAGMTVEQAIKLNWNDYLDSENSERITAALEKSAATNSDIINDYVFLNLPGCPPKTYLRSTLRVIASTSDRYLVYCMNENLTAQTESETESRRLTEQLRIIMESVDVGIAAFYFYDKTTKVIFANNNFYDMFGYTKQQYIDEVTDIYMTVAAEDRNFMREKIAKIHLEKSSEYFVFRAIRRDGEMRWFRITASTGRFSDYEHPVQLSIFRDITEEKLAEQKVQYTTELMQTIIADTPGGFSRIRLMPDGSKKLIFFNDGLCRLLCMDRDEINRIYEKDAFAGVHPDDLKAVTDIFDSMLETGETASARYRLNRGGNNYIRIMMFGRAIKSETDDTYFNMFYTDITEQVKKEELQKELLDNLPCGAALYEYDGNSLLAVHLNKRYWELVNRRQVDYSSEAFLNAIYPDDRDVVKRELESAIRQQRDMMCDLRVCSGTDKYVTFHIIAHIGQPRNGKFPIYALYTPADEQPESYQHIIPFIFSTIMNSTSDLSFAKDMDFRYICSSRAFAKMVGIENENDIIGKTDYDLFSREIADKYRRDDERLFREGKSLIDMVEPIPSKNGLPHFSSTSKHLLRDSNGKLMGLYGVGRDITEYRNTYEKLKLLTDSMPGGIATYECSNDSTLLLYFNDGFCKLLGYSHEEYEAVSENNSMGNVFDEDRPALKEKIQLQVITGEPIECEYRVHITDGSYKWISHKSVVISNKNGVVIVNVLIQDITERHETLEQLRQSKDENLLAVRLSGNIICAYDIEKRTLTMDADIAANLGMSPEIENIPDSQLDSGIIAPGSREIYKAFFDSIHSGERECSVLLQQKYLGEWRWLRTKSATVFSDNGEPIRAIISFADVTDQLEKETVYKKWQQSLEEKSRDSYTLYRCNLSKDASYDTVEGSLLLIQFADDCTDFDERTAAYAESFIYAPDRENYIALLNSDALIENYRDGTRSMVMEYREQLPDQSTRWLRLSIELVEFTGSSDIEAYLMYEDINEKKLNAILTKELSETDPLTGVLNRTTFADIVERTIRESPTGSKHALIMLDIDGFKQINDVFGHAAGDQALIDTADSLRSIIRHNDRLGRLGGDEFMVFLDDIPNESAALHKAKQMCSAVKKTFSLDVQISGSIGIAISPHDGVNFDELYKKADSALYHVKGSGRDNYAVYRAGMGNTSVVVSEETENVIVSASALPQKNKRRMLAATDNNEDFALFLELFSEDFIIERAKNAGSALARLRHYGTAAAILLLDLNLPGQGSFFLLEKMQHTRELQSVPVILINGEPSLKEGLRAIRAGATDFIPKPLDKQLLEIRVRSAISRAENERLRAQNSYLELRNDKRINYENALEGSSLALIEYDYLKDSFRYSPSVGNLIAGNFNRRKLWQILLSDMVADAATVNTMQELVRSIAQDEAKQSTNTVVELKTPQQTVHRFKMSIRKLTDEYKITNKLIITLYDLDSNADL